MPFGNAGWMQILLILVIILLIFGAARLPALAKSIGQSARAFKGEMKQMKEEGRADSAADDSAAEQSAPSPAPESQTSDAPRDKP